MVYWLSGPSARARPSRASRPRWRRMRPSSRGIELEFGSIDDCHQARFLYGDGLAQLVGARGREQDIVVIEEENQLEGITSLAL